MPPLPPARIMTVTDSLSLPVFADPVTAAVMSDTVTLGAVTQLRQNLPIMNLRTVVIRGQAFSGPNAQFVNPKIEGQAREYSSEDAELRIQPMQVTINGATQGHNGQLRATSGTLVWIYVPGHGRYVLSLAPRTELGFVKAGEVRGNVVSFTASQDQLRLELMSPAVIGETAYVLYVLHDAEWAPTSQGQGGLMLCG